MTQIGESISAAMFVEQKEEHNGKTCPWCSEEEKAKKAEQMPEESPTTDGDNPETMPKNNAKNLEGQMLKAEKERYKKAGIDKKAQKPKDKVTLKFASKKTLVKPGGGTKKSDGTYRDLKVEVYEPSDEKQYDLQYAAHHLIPGNESLKESKLSRFLGDDEVIKNFNASGQSSYVKEGQSVGYDVNCAENGVWLPTPYALSNKNKWPSSDGKKYIFEEKGQRYVEFAVSFQEAYVAAAINTSNGKQFHMRHNKYSEEVKDVLDGMAEKMLMMIGGQCSKAAKTVSNEGKIEAPAGLVPRLNMLSAQLKRLLTGRIWHSPFFADNEGMKTYIENLEKADNPSADIEKVI